MVQLASVLISLAGATLLATIIRRLTSKPTYNIFAPIWIIYELGIVSEIAKTPSIIPGIIRTLYSHLRKFTGGSLWGLTSKHQVFVDDSSAVQLFSLPNHTLTPTPITLTLYDGPLGNKNLDDHKEKVLKNFEFSIGAISRNFMNDARVDEFMDQIDIPKRAAILIGFLGDSKKLNQWERSAGVKLLPNNSEVQVDNFFKLVRDFTTYLVIQLMYGQNFCDRNPEIVTDYWQWDDHALQPLLTGVPEWFPLPSLRRGIAARKRLHKAMEDLEQRIEQQSPDITDLKCTITQETGAGCTKLGFTPAQRAAVHHANLFGASANMNPTLAWFVFFIYSTPGLLETLREEIAPYVTLSDTNPPQILKINHTGLAHQCPRLKSALLETYRLCVEAFIIRYAKKPITIIDAGNNNAPHEIQPGTYLSVPLSLKSLDEEMYPDPTRFDPERFLEIDTETGKLVARYGKLRPWGVGPHICKGRVYAEKMQASVAACIISLWDVRPAGGVGKDGEWPVYGRVRSGNGVRRPDRDISVVMKRRVLT